MGFMLKQYIDRFAAMEKKAMETLSGDPEALVGVDSFPGSEHDAKVPESAKKPDEEVTQGQPAGATSTEGAVVGGDAKPLNEGKLEIDQALTNPEQKPMITDDALTAKEASARLESLVADLLNDIGGPAQKQASLASQSAQKTQQNARQPIRLDDETISKIAAAQAAFMAGREAAENQIKKASSQGTASNARKLIKDACVKAAQEQGLSDAEAEAAAENAMAAAGVAPEQAAATDAAATDAAAAGADAAAAGADAAAAGADAGAADAAAAAEIPEDVTEEELAEAIVDLVSSGELDPDTAKALVDEIAGEEAAAAPTEDQAAEIIAQGLESGEITPEQAKEIAAAVEAGATGEAAEADAEAQGAADAEAAIQDAQDEAQGAADAEAAMKSAAAHIRSNAINKVASAVVAKREAAKPGARVLSKVASILQSRKAAIDASAAANSDEARYMQGFRKKAAAMGVDPSALARYVLSQKK